MPIAATMLTTVIGFKVSPQKNTRPLRNRFVKNTQTPTSAVVVKSAVIIRMIKRTAKSDKKKLLITSTPNPLNVSQDRYLTL